MIIPAKVQKFMEDIVYPVNPKFVIKNKAHKTGLYAIASFFGKIFNPELDTRYITVSLGECWYPAHYFDTSGNLKEDRANEVIEIMAHEVIHEYDRKRIGTVPYTIAYAFPQILAVFALGAIGAIWNPWWLLCLLFLLLLAPIPAPGRAWAEIRGYHTNMMVTRLIGHDPKYYAEWAADTQFCSPAYYFMFPFRDYVINKLMETEYEKEEIYIKIKNWLVAQKEAELQGLPWTSGSLP